MEQLLSSVTEFAVELLVIIVGTLLSVTLHKVKVYLNTLKKKDELGIIDLITDAATEYAEAELKGKKGIEKRDFAIEKALTILNSKGIKLSEEEVIAGIENAVRKLNKK
jgi:LL-H family phage holin